MTIKERNSKDLQKAWKKFLRTQNEKEKAEKENQKAEEKDLGFIDLENVRSCYPESKRLSECLCTAYASEYNVPIKVARLSQTFGAGIHYSENQHRR